MFKCGFIPEHVWLRKHCSGGYSMQHAAPVRVGGRFFSLGMLSWLMVALITLLSVPVSGSAATRYAAPAPSGSGNCDSWGNACTLQSALTSASNVDEIWVRQGIHKPTSGSDRNATFQLKDGVAVYGGFAGTESSRDERNWEANVTTLSGDLLGNDSGFNNNSENSHHVVTGSNGATIDGFIISGGNANTIDNYGGGMYNTSSNPTVANITFSGNSASTGGGMYNLSSSPTLTHVTFSGNNVTADGAGMYNKASSPTLTDVTFSGNTAKNVGGGMFNMSGSTPKLTDVTFTGNTAIDIGGGMYNWGSSPILNNIVFSGNTVTAGDGGAIYNTSSSPQLTNVFFNGNTVTNGNGGAIYNTSSSNPQLTIVNFSSNSAGAGGAIYNDASNPAIFIATFSGNSAASGGAIYSISSSPALASVTFSTNSASNGGGMYNNSSSPILLNVTFSGNSSSSLGGGIFNYSSSPQLTNVTFSGNSGGGIYNFGGFPVIRNSIVWGNSGGEIDNNSATLTLADSVISGGCPASSTCSGIIAADPLLGLLGFYGGLTQTVPLLPGSSAIGATASNCPTIDQRGVARVTTCAIGAFESQGFTLTKTGGDNQSTQVGTPFATPLTLSVTAKNVFEPVNGGKVSFTAPASGASTTIAPTITVIIVGGAATQSVTANATTGSYSVNASTVVADSVSYSLTNTPPPPVFTSAASATFTYNVADSFTVIATGAQTFATTSTLPAGVTLASNGTLSGTPAGAGVYPLTIKATNGGGTAEQNFTLTVNKSAPTASVINSPVTYDGTAKTAAVTCSGGGVASNITTGGAASQINIGSYPVIADCAASANYNAATGLFAGDFVINPSPIMLPDTGQTKCYQAVDPFSEIPCTGTGQDGAYSINPMSYTDNGNGTITDNNTGLVWQKCSIGQNNDAGCSGTSSGSNWYQASGTYHADYNATTQNICGTLSLAGGGWRLPSRKELHSIVDYSIPSPGPAIVQTVFPNTPPSSFYWTSTTVALNSGLPLAWHVFFGGTGFSISFTLKEESSSPIYVRCVR